MTTLDHAQPTLTPAQVALAKGRIIELRRQAYSAEYCAREAGISRRTLYDWTAADPEFLAAWQEANESRLDWHEDVLRDCAQKGMFVPSLAVLKSAGRIIDRQAPTQVTVSLYSVFQSLIQPEHQAIIEVSAQLAAPQPQPEQGVPAAEQPQLQGGTTQAPKGKPSAKPASRRRPERQPLPR